MAQVDQFEVAVSGAGGCGDVTTPFPPHNALEWFRPGLSQPLVDFSSSFSIASADGRILYGLNNRWTSPGFDLVRHTGWESSTVIYSTDVYEPLTIAQAGDGRLFVVASSGPTDSLLVFSTAGTLEATYPFVETRALAVGADNCTLYYPVAGAIARFNGCTGTPMTPFAVLPGVINDVFPLADGGMLASVDGNVVVLNAAGVVTRTLPLSAYGFAGYAAQIALAPDGVLFLAVGRPCESGGLLRVSFADGTELSRRSFIDIDEPFSLVLRAAAAFAVPTASETTLLIIAIAAAGAFVLRLRA